MNTGRENDEKTFVKTCSLQSCWNLIQRIECFCFVREFFFSIYPQLHLVLVLYCPRYITSTIRHSIFGNRSIETPFQSSFRF